MNILENTKILSVYFKSIKSIKVWVLTEIKERAEIELDIGSTVSVVLIAYFKH